MPGNIGKQDPGDIICKINLAVILSIPGFNYSKLPV